MLSVSRKIQLASQDTGFELDCAISTITKACRMGPKIGEEEHVHGGIGWQGLLQSEVAGLIAEIPLLQAFERFAAAMEDISARLQSLPRR